MRPFSPKHEKAARGAPKSAVLGERAPSPNLLANHAMALTEGYMPPHLCEHKCRTDEEPERATRHLPPEAPSQAKTPSSPETSDETTKNTAPTEAWRLEVDAANWQNSSTEYESAPTSTTQPSTGWTTAVPSTSPYSPSTRNLVRNLFNHTSTSDSQDLTNTIVEAMQHSTDNASLTNLRTGNTHVPPTGTPSSTSTPRHTQLAPTRYSQWVVPNPTFPVPHTRSRSTRRPRKPRPYCACSSYPNIRRRNLLKDFNEAATTINDDAPNIQPTTSPAAPWGRCARAKCHRALQLTFPPNGPPALHCPRGHSTAGRPERHHTRTRT